SAATAPVKGNIEPMGIGDDPAAFAPLLISRMTSGPRAAPATTADVAPRITARRDTLCGIRSIVGLVSSAMTSPPSIEPGATLRQRRCLVMNLAIYEHRPVITVIAS